MRAGQMIATTTPQETTEKELAELMVGKSLQHEHRPERAPSQKIVLKAEEVCVRGAEGLLAVDHVSFLLRAGEVLGVLDIDSPVSGRFDGDDLDGLEAAAAFLAKKIAG